MATTAPKASGFKAFDTEAESIHHPPWFAYSLGAIGIIVGVGANLWQVVTSVIAFSNMFIQGAVYKSLDAHGQSTATTGAFLVSIGMAVSFQLGVLFFVFRLHKEFKETKTKTGSDGMQAVKHTAVAMVNHHKLLIGWAALSFIADTVGDFTFITSLSEDFFLVIMYTLSLYAASTVILSVALERHWSAKVAYTNWKAFKMYVAIMHQKLHNEREDVR